MKKKVCIIGARSLVGGELIKLLLNHRYVEIEMLISDGEEEDITISHPYLRGMINMKTEKFDDQKIIERCDVVFNCTRASLESMTRMAELVGLAAKKCDW